MKIFYIALFGLLGVFARYYIGLYVGRSLNSSLPFGTFIINIVGCFVIGIIYVFGVERNILSAELRVGIMVGLIGGFTTFSSYCMEAVSLFEAGEFLYSFLYLSLSPVLGFMSSFMGMSIARKILGVQL